MFLTRTCAGCGARPTTRKAAMCVLCAALLTPVGPITEMPGLSVCGALYHYGGPVRRAIVTAKSGTRADVFRAVAPELATLATALGAGTAPPQLVVWVPASRRGRAVRGFDQGRVMATIVGRRLGVPARRALAGGRRSQIGQGRVDRLAASGYRARGVVPDRVLLVDDVVTTGASMRSAADALRSAGASSVVGVAVAWAASTEELAAGRPLLIGRTSGPFARA